MIKKESIIKYVLLLSPFVDLLTGLLKSKYNIMFSPSAIYRGIFFLFLSFCFLYQILKFKINQYRIFGIYLLLYLIIFTITRGTEYPFLVFLSELLYLTRYLIFPLSYIVLKNNIDGLNFTSIKESVRMSGFIYAMLVLIPFITGKSFESYELTGLAGQVGFFHGANEIGSILGITLFYYDVNLLLDFKDKSFSTLNHKMYTGVIVNVLAILITGTKLSFVLLIFYFFMIIFKLYIRLRGATKNIILVLLSVILLSTFIFSPAFANLKLILSGSKNVLGALLSGRTVYLNNNLNMFSASSFIQKAFGMGMNQYDSHGGVYLIKLAEMDIFDVLVIYGVVSLPLIYYPYYSYITNVGKNYRKFRPEEYQLHAISILSFLWSFFIGHVVGSPSVSLFIVLTLLLSMHGQRQYTSK